MDDNKEPTLKDLLTAINNQSANLSKEIKDECEKVNKNVDTKMVAITAEVSKLSEKIKEQEDTIKAQQKEIQELKDTFQESMKNQQIESKRNNLIIHSLFEGEKDNAELKAKLINIFKQECNIDLQEWHLGNFFRLGKPIPNKIRPILVAFTGLAIKQQIEGARKELKTITISGDMPKCILEARKQLQPTMDKFRREGRRVFYKYDKLYVDGALWEGESSNPTIHEKTEEKREDKTQKRGREEEELGPKQLPSAKKVTPKTTIIGINNFRNSTPRGPKSIQKKLAESFAKTTQPTIDLNQSLRSEDAK